MASTDHWKFWGRDESSSDDSDSDAESSSSGSTSSDEEKDVRKKASPAVPSRWAAMEDSSDEEDDKRVVRSAKDKQTVALKQTLKVMANHKKIEDFAQMQTGFESLLKTLSKSSALIEREGFPGFVCKALIELETYVNERFADKSWRQKLTKARAIAFNTLRAKVRKGIDDYRERLDHYRTNTAAYAEESSDFESSSDSSRMTSGSSEDSSESSSETESTSSDSDKSEWSSSDSDASDAEGGIGETDIHKIGLERWGKKVDAKEKVAKVKAAKDKGTRVKETKVEQFPQIGKAREALLAPGEKIDAELLSKKMAEITALRGRKGFDRAEHIRHLHELANAAKGVSPKSRIEILAQLISACLDASHGTFVAMPSGKWVECREQMEAALDLLRKEKGLYFSFVVAEDEDGSGGETDGEPNAASTAALLKAQRDADIRQAGEKGTEEASSKEARAQRRAALTFAVLLERLDNELTKALQLADVHSDEYKVRLGQRIDVLALLWKAYLYYEECGHTECAQNMSMRVLGHIYYINNNIAHRMWDLIKKRLSEADAARLSGRFAYDKIVSTLVRKNLESVDQGSRVKAILFAAYNEALRGRFYEARDLIQTGNVQEYASQCHVGTKILFNRNLVQLGLSAFRLGLITEAHGYLSEVCAMGRYKELLAQGLSNPKGVEKTQEQEKSEKERLLPYHMHIAADLVEAIHNICAMLLEVPSMAANPFDSTKKPIARNFRRLLEAYDRQPFAGPPENPREIVMAATKALQKGDWKTCANYIMEMKIWSGLPDADQVKEILLTRIKREALRTYLFSFSSLYDSFSVQQLASMFDLPQTVAHSTVSKMMMTGSLSASWDESSSFILINHIEKTPLQVLALQLTDKITMTADQNEQMINYRNPKYVLAQANQRDDRGGRRFDDRWGQDRRFDRREGQRDDRDVGRSMFGASRPTITYGKNTDFRRRW